MPAPYNPDRVIKSYWPPERIINVAWSGGAIELQQTTSLGIDLAGLGLFYDAMTNEGNDSWPFGTGLHSDSFTLSMWSKIVSGTGDPENGFTGFHGIPFPNSLNYLSTLCLPGGVTVGFLIGMFVVTDRCEKDEITTIGSQVLSNQWIDSPYDQWNHIFIVANTDAGTITVKVNGQDTSGVQWHPLVSPRPSSMCWKDISFYNHDPYWRRNPEFDDMGTNLQYADFQLWINQEHNDLNYFWRGDGATDGKRIAPSVAQEQFGMPDFFFSGGKDQWLTNQGTHGGVLTIDTGEITTVSAPPLWVPAE